ncbi:histidine phosphatase family protein [Actinospongicola halichondriae]|uniref:histidine phosphatase family protein n=1 Tax=Actinospongicola halichondriae TaxID=3236844 RepID=UPI003D384042
MDLLIIRHALPQRVEVVGRAADPPLAPLGHRQARAAAEWLAVEDIDAVYSSPMTRALETAEPIGTATKQQVVVEDGVAEYDRNAEAYVPIEELKAEGDPRWTEMLAGGYFSEEGVDPVEFQAGVVDAMERIIAAHPSRTAAVVCHGGVINAYVGHILGLAEYMVFQPAYTGITRVRASSRGHRSLISLNEHGHLRGVE